MRGETVTVVRYTPTGETDPGGSPVTKDAGCHVECNRFAAP